MVRSRLLTAAVEGIIMDSFSIIGLNRNHQKLIERGIQGNKKTQTIGPKNRWGLATKW